MSKIVDGIIKKVYKYFDLDTFENKTESVDIQFTPATNITDALANISQENQQAFILEAINSANRAQALAKAEEAVIAKGGKKSVVLSVMKPFRAMPPFNSYFVFETDGKTKKLRTRKTRSGETVTEPEMDKSRQDKEIMALLKAQPALMASIRQASLEAIGSDEEDENEE
jgi:hypothetical protein